MEKSKEINARSLEFDILKGLAIFLVLCGHSIMSFSSADRHSNIFYVLIYSFHMPLFMFISGYFSERTLVSPLKNIFSKKFWQLIYPAITFGIIFFVVDMILWGKSPRQFLGYIWGVFWFLKSCFLCFVIFGICLKVCKNNILWGCILGLLISQFLPFFRLTYMLPFFIMGFLINRNKYIIYNKPATTCFYSLIGFVLLFLWFNNKGLNDFPLMKIKSAIFDGDLIVLKDFAFYQVIRLFMGLCGSIMVITGVITIVKRGYLKNFQNLFSAFGSQTLLIYILQTLLLEDIMAKLIDLNKLNLYFYSLIVVPLISFAIMDLCLYISKWLSKGSKSKILISGFGNRKNKKNVLKDKGLLLS